MTLSKRLLRLTPPRYRQAAGELKNRPWGGFARRHYAQVGEDIIVGGLLRGAQGFYIDVGAHPPQRYSNTQLLYERGWRGINVEPNPAAARAFARVRPRDTILVCGIGEDKAILPY